MRGRKLGGLLSLIVVGAVLVAGVNTGYAHSRVTALVRVPALTHISLQAAYQRLHRAGLRVSIPARFAFSLSIAHPVVLKASVASGDRLAAKSIVSLDLGCPGCGLASPGIPLNPPSYAVPNFVGQSITAAENWRAGKTMYLDIEFGRLTAGDAPTLLGNYRISRQNPTAGSAITDKTGLTVWAQQIRSGGPDVGHPSSAHR